MNTYNENLQNTVINTLSDIYAETQDRKSVLKTTVYTLYQAQGAEITARDKLKATKDLMIYWGHINDQAVINDNQAYNLLTCATDVSKVVGTSITNTATAASNVQIASNAISLLASDIGAALNVAMASLYGTDIQNRLEEANDFINEVANNSRRIAQDAMNASANTSEVIAAEVLTLAKSCKIKASGVLKTTQSKLKIFSNLAITEVQTIDDASRLERQAEGTFDDAVAAAHAINDVYERANKKLNMNLNITVLSGNKIKARFEGAPSSVPTFSSLQTPHPIPDANPTYYLTFIPADTSSIFSTDQATQLFQQAGILDGVGSNNEPGTIFFKISPKEDVLVSLKVDAFGEKIKSGSNYVAYIFTILDMKYMQYISNFSDLLSAPSQPFIPVTKLPIVQTITKGPDSEPDDDNTVWTTFTFDVKSFDVSEHEAELDPAASHVTAAATIQTAKDNDEKSSAAIADRDEHEKIIANDMMEKAKDIADTATNVKNVIKEASIAASGAKSAAIAANRAWVNVITAQSTVASVFASQAASGSGTGDGKVKGKAGSNTDSNDALNQAKAQSAAQELDSAKSKLLQLVIDAESTAKLALTAASKASDTVTSAIAPIAVVIENNTASAAALAAQTTNVAAPALVNDQAQSTDATVNLTSVQIEQTTAGIDAALVDTAAPETSMTGPTLASVTAAFDAVSKALTAARNAVIVVKGVFNTTPLDKNDGSDSSAQSNKANVEAAISAVVDTTKNAHKQTSDNAEAAEIASHNAHENVKTQTNKASEAASKYTTSAAKALEDKHAATKASNAAKAVIAKAGDMASKKVNSTSAPENLPSNAEKKMCANVDYEFRCILIQADIGDSVNPHLNLSRTPDDKLAPLLSPQLLITTPIYFNLDIAEKISAANYVVAEIVKNTDASKISQQTGNIKFSSINTDNFGNFLIPGDRYNLYILTVTQPKRTEEKNLVNQLSQNLGTYRIGSKAKNGVSGKKIQSPTI